MNFAYLDIFVTTVAIRLQAYNAHAIGRLNVHSLSSAATILQQKDENKNKGKNPRPKCRVRRFYRIANTAMDALLDI